MTPTIQELEATAHVRLNCGSGLFPLRFWTNLDSDPTVPADIHATVPPLPYEDEALHEVYAGHFLEHLTYADGQAFLRECFRCLAPGGRLGVLVPDTRVIMRRWLEGDPDEVEVPPGQWWSVADLDDVCGLFLYSTVQASHHQWSYDAQTLRRAGERAGFRFVRAIDRYHDPRIPHGAWYQCGADFIKPGGER